MYLARVTIDCRQFVTETSSTSIIVVQIWYIDAGSWPPPWLDWCEILSSSTRSCLLSVTTAFTGDEYF